MLYLIAFLGAGIGGALRYGVNVWAVRAFGVGFPFGTLIVNIVGLFAMGLLVGFFAYRAGLVPQHVRLFLTTGVLGGFTTSFCLLVGCGPPVRAALLSNRDPLHRGLSVREHRCSVFGSCSVQRR